MFARRLLVMFLLLLAPPLQGAVCDAAGVREVDPGVRVSGWGVNRENHRFIPGERAGITRGNLTDLELQWVFGLPGAEAPRFMPLLTVDTVVITDEDGGVYALDRATGCEKWRFDAGAMVRTALRHVQHDGMHLVVFGTMDAELIALDLVTGAPRWRNVVAEHPRAMISGSAVDHAGVIYQPISSWEVAWAVNPFYACCTFRGSVVALRADTGAVLWRAHTIEELSGVVESRLLLPDRKGPSGAPVWSQPTLDLKRRLIYVGTGENYSAPATDTSDAILAFDMDTGEMRWKRQFLASDAWNVACVIPGHGNCPEEEGEDLDFGAPPVLVNYRGRDLILAGQKSGRVFALDPDRDGEVQWSYRAGAGGKAGGVHFGMAADPGRGVLYVPISDRPVAYFGDSSDGVPYPSLHAVDITSGEPVWAVAAPGDCLEHESTRSIDGCFPGFSAAITVTEDLVFAPTLDGHLRVFDAADGRQLWSYDTRVDFDTVNGVAARGGALDMGGVFVDSGQLFVSSGYGLFEQLPGNAFMVFTVTAGDRKPDGAE